MKNLLFDRFRLLVLVPQAAAGFVLLCLALPNANAAGSEKWGSNLQMHAIDGTQFNSANLNINTIRMGLRWDEVEKDRGNRDWATTTTRVNAAGATGVQILGVVGNPKGWALVGSPGGNIPGPNFRDDYADYVLDVMQHYYPTIKYFEILNEPDLGLGSIADAQTRADAYIEILNRVWNKTATFRSTRADLKIVGMTLAHPPVSNNVYTNAYFNMIWGNTTARSQFHILSFHTYTGYYMPETGNSAGDGPLDTNLVNSVNAINGAKPLWITEGGYSTGNDGKGIANPANGTGTQSQPELWQARYLVRMASIIRGNGIQRFLQFNLYSAPGAIGEDQWGLIKSDGSSHKQAYAAYARLNTIIGPSVTSFQKIETNNNGIYKFKYLKSGIVAGWIVWAAPHATTPINTTMWGTGSSARKMPMTGGSWTSAPYNSGSVTIAATNEPVYVEILP